MSSTYGENLKLSIFGQSHSTGIGMTLDGIPAGLPVDVEKLHKFMSRRAPGRNPWSTARKEEDIPEFLSGLMDGFTCGAPLAAVIQNKNTRSKDYSNLVDCPRPGHADYTAQIKYGGFQDPYGGGHFSGRLTAPLCVAGGLCKQWLEEKGIVISARISSIAGVNDVPIDPVHPDLSFAEKEFPVISDIAGEKMRQRIEQLRQDGDSSGGTIQCFVTGLPAGIGEPMFGGVESRIASIIYGIPAVKALSFGDGFLAASMTGSKFNDPFTIENGCIKTETNHAGGILGGITNGMPLIFEVTIKPTPSISMQQKSVSLSAIQAQTLTINGRHDPCIVPRAVPVIESAAALALFDMILGYTKTDRRKSF